MPFWTLDLNITGLIVSPAAGPSFRYAPLVITVPAASNGHKPTIEPGLTLAGRFSAMAEGLPAGDSASATGVDVENHDLALTRHLAWPADKSLEVIDGPKDQPEGTIRLAGNIDLPNANYQVSDGGQSVGGTGTFAVPLQVELPYDPGQTSQTATVKTQLPTPVDIDGTATVTIKRRAAALLYQANDTIDMLDSLPLMRGKFPTSLSSTLATGSEGLLIHGNSHIGVMVDGSDQGGMYRTVRLKRTWSYTLLANDTRGPLSGAVQPWDIDTEGAGPSWDDVPGSEAKVMPAKWPREEELDEYLVRVDSMPEFGALYFAVIIDRKPNAYKLRLFAAETIDFDTWCRIRASSAPYFDSVSMFGQNDDSWRPVLKK